MKAGEPQVTVTYTRRHIVLRPACFRKEYFSQEKTAKDCFSSLHSHGFEDALDTYAVTVHPQAAINIPYAVSTPSPD